VQKDGCQRKKLSSKKFGIKFGGYFLAYDKNGNVQKAKNGRITSIFSGNNTTNTEGHIYKFPFLAKSREIVVKKIGRTDYDWEGSGADWVAHQNSAHLGGNVTKMSKKDGAIVDEIIEGNIIPMRGNRENKGDF
jgi:hypothetical protein